MIDYQSSVYWVKRECRQKHKIQGSNVWVHIYVYKLKIKIQLRFKKRSQIGPQVCCLCYESSDVIKPACAHLQAPTVCINSQLHIEDLMLVAWNWPWWQYSHHRNQQILSPLHPTPFRSTPSQLLNIYHRMIVWKESIVAIFSKSNNSFWVCHFHFFFM